MQRRISVVEFLLNVDSQKPYLAWLTVAMKGSEILWRSFPRRRNTGKIDRNKKNKSRALTNLRASLSLTSYL